MVEGFKYGQKAMSSGEPLTSELPIDGKINSKPQ
jgi:hypothetical protein